MNERNHEPMTHSEYIRKREFLISVLNDAKNRGDYYLEFDTMESIEKLEEEWSKEE